MSNHQVIHDIRQSRQPFDLRLGIARYVFIFVETQNILMSAFKAVERTFQ